jgi:hypothetical protein
MNTPLRRLWGLAAVGGAVAVAVTTHDAGFTALTLVGGLALPRILGFGGRWQGRRGWAGGCAGVDRGRSRIEERLGSWHRQAQGETPAESTGAPTAGVA